MRSGRMSMVVLSGAAADVDPSMVSDWSSCLQTMYALRDIINADETDCFSEYCLFSH